MEKNVALIALFAALIAVLGLIPKVTLGFGVPITAQSLGIMLAGAVLGSKRGALAVLLFLLLVAVGLPLLAGGRGGLGVFFGPTGGFLFSWPVAAWLIGFIVEKWRQPPLVVSVFVASILGGIVLSYAMGIVGLSLALGKSLTESTSLMLVFIPGDLIKAAVAGALTSALAKARPSSVLSRA